MSSVGVPLHDQLEGQAPAGTLDPERYRRIHAELRLRRRVGSRLPA